MGGFHGAVVLGKESGAAVLPAGARRADPRSPYGFLRSCKQPVRFAERVRRYASATLHRSDEARRPKGALRFQTAFRAAMAARQRNAFSGLADDEFENQAVTFGGRDRSKFPPREAVVRDERVVA